MVYETILKNKDIKFKNQDLKSLIAHKFYPNKVITKSNIKGLITHRGISIP